MHFMFLLTLFLLILRYILYPGVHILRVIFVLILMSWFTISMAAVTFECGYHLGSIVCFYSTSPPPPSPMQPRPHPAPCAPRSPGWMTRGSTTSPRSMPKRPRASNAPSPVWHADPVNAARTSTCSLKDQTKVCPQNNTGFITRAL